MKSSFSVNKYRDIKARKQVKPIVAEVVVEPAPVKKSKKIKKAQENGHA